jgi:hypothetical protein
VEKFCFQCPFGAICYGGNKVTSLPSHWGWKISESKLPKEFLLLPEGYGCQENQCQDINSCGANRNSVLCGGCETGFSAAFFTTDCVPDDQCSSWKLWVLVLFALMYCLFYSIYFRYDSELLSSLQSKCSDNADKCRTATQQESSEGAFHVLMWYYQLAGLLLSMPNPLKFVDGDALIMNIIGIVFGTVPVSQVFNLPSLVFCTAAGSAPADILFANLAFYVLWAAVMVVLSFQRIWLPIFRFIYAIVHAAPEYMDNYEIACESLAIWGTAGKFLAIFLALKLTLEGFTWSKTKSRIQRLLVALASSVKYIFGWISLILSWMGCKQHSPATLPTNQVPTHPPVYPSEVRGRAWLDFGVTAYSALLALMIQLTTCVSIQGYQDNGRALAELRWFYDGRIACFSDDGERPGQWQIAALIAVVILTCLPLGLALYMQRAMMKPEAAINVFDTSALPTYSEQYKSSTRHWFTVL